MRVLRTSTFDDWFNGLRDVRVRRLIQQRLNRFQYGIGGSTEHVGDSKYVGGRVHEVRIHYGPGYRVYYTRHGDVLVYLLCGGDKSSQARDIKRAQKLAEEVAWDQV